ncbi:MAG: RidA family protein [Dehalococcoidia bacterium]
MDRQVVNPWTWQDEYGFVQANRIEGPSRFLVCAGQSAMNSEGQPQFPGDIRGQLTLALDNLETVIQQGGFRLADIVRLNIYTTDVDLLFANYDVIAERLGAAGVRFAGSMLGVTRLAFPELMVELEATAAA